MHEKSVLKFAEAESPIKPWQDYIKWIRSEYPSSNDTLLPVLERAVRALLDQDIYKNDPRYLALWIEYADLLTDATGIMTVLIYVTFVL
jgi:checkpoint serine/threonine-protein kinase